VRSLPIRGRGAGGLARQRVRLPDPARQTETARHALARAGWSVANDSDGALVVDVGAERAHEITQTLAGINVFVSELAPITRSLEDVFLELTHEDPGGPA
jgi:hypothetical protein